MGLTKMPPKSPNRKAHARRHVPHGPVHLVDSTFEEVLESYKRRGYIVQ